MGLQYTLNRMVMGTVRFFDRFVGLGVYCEDGLIDVHCHDFVRDPAFVRAYERGIAATGKDHQMRWRVHVALWVARCASSLNGDFVECGVNRGFVSSAIMEHLDWDQRGRCFYLLDTFAGLDARFLSKEEIAAGALRLNKKKLKAGEYVTGVDSVRRNFAQWKNVEIIQGAIPDTLTRVPSEAVAYLHLDMNCAPPEVAAFDFFWPKLLPGAFVLLDDYAYRGFGSQKAAMDAAASAKGVQVLSLPTGQGLIVKPS